MSVNPFSSSDYFRLWRLFFLTLVIIFQNEGNIQAQVIPIKPVSLIDHNMGLISSFNYYIYKDTRGLVWICSISGLYQFDGKRVREYKPDPINRVNVNPQYIHSKFIEDTYGNIWFGTWRGLSCYVRSNDTFESHLLLNSNPATRFSVIGADSVGQLWFLHNYGIYTYHMKTGVMIRRADILHKLDNAEIQLNNNGEVQCVFGFNRNKELDGVYNYEFESSQLCNVSKLEFKPEIDSVYVSDVDVLEDNSILYATSRGLFYSNNNLTAQHLRTPEIKQNCEVTSITPYIDQLYLVATATYDYYLFDLKSNRVIKRFELAHKGESIKAKPLSMYTDEEGTIWIYLEGLGVAYFNAVRQIFDYYPIHVSEAGRNVILDANKLVEIDSNVTLAITRTSKSYFVHSKHGNIIGVSPCNNCPIAVNGFIKDSDGGICLGTSKGLYRLDKNFEVRLILSTKNIRFGSGFCMLNDGRIINVYSGKLLISNGKTGGKMNFTRLTDIDTSLYYSNIAYLPDGLLYFNCSEMVSNYKFYLGAFNPLDHFKLMKCYPVDWGIRDYQRTSLPYEYIIASTLGPCLFNPVSGASSVLELAGVSVQKIWRIFKIKEYSYLLGGEKSVLLLDLNSKNSKIYDSSFGLGMENVTWYGPLLHSSGKIWLGHKQGISIVDPGLLYVSEHQSRVNITEIRINDQLNDSAIRDMNGITNPNEIKNLNLSYKQNTISFDYAAISFSENNEYEYRITGLEKEWVNGNKAGFTRYVNLPSGKYTFEVRVKNQPKSLHTIEIQIFPPYYETWWFLSVVALTLVFLIYQLAVLKQKRRQRLLQIQFEKQLALEHERLRISYNLHDDLGSDLSALNLKVKLMAQRFNDDFMKSEFNYLSKTLNRLAQQVRETIWTINSSNDTVDSLLTHLHQYTLDYFEGSGIHCSVKLMEHQNLQPVSGNHRRELCFCYKEILHNVLKHSYANEIIVEMWLNREQILRIRVQDNGKGFDTSIPYSGLGLPSIKSRIREIGGSLEIESNSSGSTVIISYKL